MKPSASADRFAEEQKRQQEEDLLINAIYKDYGKLLKKLAINNGVELDDVEDLIQDTIVSYYLAYDLTPVSYTHLDAGGDGGGYEPISLSGKPGGGGGCAGRRSRR